MARRKPKQLTMDFPQHGGARAGAGRPRGPLGGPGHSKRPVLNARHPLHVTLKVKRELSSLRTKAKVKTIRAALGRGCLRDGFRVVDWSIQGDHAHLIVEAGSKEQLTAGMQGLSIRIARGLNRACARSGKVFAQRYHARALSTPREVRNARAYVLLNARKHAAQHGRVYPRTWIDPFSSGSHFDGWRDGPPAVGHDGQPVAASPPRTWLLRVGWRRHGLLRIDEVPGASHT